MTRVLFGLSALLSLLLPANAAAASEPDLGWLDDYDVAWTGPGKNSADSMPCGGGDIGLNVWIEGNDLLFYADRSGNIDENDQQLKCGRFRLALDSAPFSDPAAVRQKLVLRHGSVEFAGRGLKGRIWVEVAQPIIHVDLETQEKTRLSASYESWRTTTHEIPLTLGPDGKPSSWDNNRWSMFGYFWYRGEVRDYADHVRFLNDDPVVEFAHQNNNADLIFDKEVRLEGLEEAAAGLVSPTHDRIFGGRMQGDGLIAAGTSRGKYAGVPYTAWKLESAKAACQHHLRIFLATERDPSLSSWSDHLAVWSATRRGRDAEAWTENVAWWEQFWARSHIVINRGKGPADLGWRIGRNYQLFRYQLACNATGEWPTRFNGGLFTFDVPEDASSSGDRTAWMNPDYRAWGAWTGQNQRLVYWPMLRNGDFDAIKPQFEFYRRNLPNGIARTRESWHIDGASFGEQIGSGGLPLGSHYGWEPPYGDRDPAKEVGLANLHATYYTTQLEIAYMIHEYWRYTGADISEYIPLLEDVVIFHFEYFKMLQRRRNGHDWDDAGRLVLDPAHALETYHGRNPTDVICALQVNLEGLLALPDAWVPAERKARYRDWLGRLPPLNFREREGHRVISPVASEPGPIGNYEIPQLYPVFPYGIFGLGHADLQVARDTWTYGVDPCLGPEPWTPPKPGDKPWYPSRTLWYGWAQQGIWMARLGLTAEATGYMTKKLDDARGNNDYDSPQRMRFPSFWGPGFDWTPDHNWGGSGMIMLQEMLLQTPDHRLLVLPSWPADWDVDFRLHAPGDTVVEAVYAGGRMKHLATLPASRQVDLADWHTRTEAGAAPAATHGP